LSVDPLHTVNDHDRRLDRARNLRLEWWDGPSRWQGWLSGFPDRRAIVRRLVLMAAGIAWGAYSLRGRGAGDPVQTTSDNFWRAVPLVLVLALVQLPLLTASPVGVIWAALSGTLTSGLGYVIWYAALARLTTGRPLYSFPCR
jgi:drug/metabolite transporter (DMT)-like permease